MTCKNKLSFTRRKAFTLIELLIVIAIIGILFIVLVSKVDFATDKAKATGVQTDFRSFQLAFDTVAKENSGFNTFGWDMGDANQDGIRNSYDEGDNGAGGGTAQNGIQDGTEVFTGHKVYAETFTKVYSLKKNGSGSFDRDALNRLETAINANLDPKLHITIADDGAISMANGAQDPWNKEYHGWYITNAEMDGKDRGAIIMYSDGANNEFGSEHKIANGVVTISIPGNNKFGKDDYAIVSAYTYVNGYGEVKNVTTGFSNNQTMSGDFTTKNENIEQPEKPDIPDDSEHGGFENVDNSQYNGFYLIDYSITLDVEVPTDHPDYDVFSDLYSYMQNLASNNDYAATILEFAYEIKDDRLIEHMGIYWREANTFVSYDSYEAFNGEYCFHEILNTKTDFCTLNNGVLEFHDDDCEYRYRDVNFINVTDVEEFQVVKGSIGFHGSSRGGIIQNINVYETPQSHVYKNADGTYNINVMFNELGMVPNTESFGFCDMNVEGTITSNQWAVSYGQFFNVYCLWNYELSQKMYSVVGGYRDFEVLLFMPTELLKYYNVEDNPYVEHYDLSAYEGNMYFLDEMLDSDGINLHDLDPELLIEFDMPTNLAYAYSDLSRANPVVRLENIVYIKNGAAYLSFGYYYRDYNLYVNVLNERLSYTPESITLEDNQVSVHFDGRIVLGQRMFVEMKSADEIEWRFVKGRGRYIMGSTLMMVEEIEQIDCVRSMVQYVGNSVFEVFIDVNEFDTDDISENIVGTVYNFDPGQDFDAYDLLWQNDDVDAFRNYTFILIYPDL